jgi:hypothetical protein
MCHLSAYHLGSVFKSQMICRMFVFRIVLAFTGCGIMVTAVWGQHTPSRVFCRLPHSWNSSISKDWWLSLTAFQIVPGYASWKIVHAAVSLFIIIWHDFSYICTQWVHVLSFLQFCMKSNLLCSLPWHLPCKSTVLYQDYTSLNQCVHCYVSGGHDDFHGSCMSLLNSPVSVSMRRAFAVITH